MSGVQQHDDHILKKNIKIKLRVLNGTRFVWGRWVKRSIGKIYQHENRKIFNAHHSDE